MMKRHLPKLMNSAGASMKVILVVVLLMVLLTLQARAQHFRNAIDKLKSAYSGKENLRVVMSITAFRDSTAKTPYFSERADIKRQGTSYRYAMTTSDVLMNDKYTIMADKGAREVVVSARDPKAEAMLNNPAGFNLDSIFNAIGEPVFIGEVKGVAHYRLKQKEGTMRYVDFFLNLSKAHMEKLEYHYRDHQVAVIVFEVFDINPVFGADTFDESYFIVAAKGRIKTAARFQGYTLIGTDVE